MEVLAVSCFRHDCHVARSSSNHRSAVRRHEGGRSEDHDADGLMTTPWQSSSMRRESKASWSATACRWWFRGTRHVAGHSGRDALPRRNGGPGGPSRPGRGRHAFPSFHLGKYKAIENAGRILKETRCHAVKLEGGMEQAEVIEALASSGIPVMAHVGLRPQNIHCLGGYSVQRDREKLLADAKAAESAGVVRHRAGVHSGRDRQ